MDDLKILKIECLSSHLMDEVQILNFSLNDQTKVSKLQMNGKQHQNIKTGLSQQPMIRF